MNPDIYLPRTLLSPSNGKAYSETELLKTFNYVVILAEPGAGKTELMRSFAQQLQTDSITANIFRHMGTDAEYCPLIIDAFDELAKIDQTGIYQLLANAKKAKPTRVFISSRSSEWNEAATNTFKEFFGHTPLIARLQEFGVQEQQTIFEHYVPGENFAKFEAEVTRFDLGMLLPNPQFLKLFADAYVESGRRFTDKRSIFQHAVERLAKEANPNIIPTSSTLSPQEKLDIAAEIFSKLLLAGVEGVCVSEVSETQNYPLLASLSNRGAEAKAILATRLFKLEDNENQHRPVHRIVAEYCAADYLCKRIANPTDSLTMAKCLSIIAPNSTVRDELRGLLGWMAALGHQAIAEAAIKLDPYAVLANGDPSQLSDSSKHQLLQQLIKLETEDPYFRRGDYRRNFSASGFFSADILQEIKSLIVDRSQTDGQLRYLVFELLLADSKSAKPLQVELQQIVLTPNEDENIRSLANKCLLNIPNYNHHSNLDVLILEASSASLYIAIKTIEKLGVEKFELAYLAELLRVCANLYPKQKQYDERVIGTRYFLKVFIKNFTLSTTEWILDELSEGLSCECGKTPPECDCLTGISKIIGCLLDHYFELALPPFEIKRIWSWLRGLNFHSYKSAIESKAVKILQENHELRRGIMDHVFSKLRDHEQIINIRAWQSDLHSHSGLNFQTGDYQFIIELAYEINNPDLWASFIIVAQHQLYKNKDEQGPNELRRHMREQARKNPVLMRAWSRFNKEAAEKIKQSKQEYPHLFGNSRRSRRNRRKQKEAQTSRIKYIQDNRDLIESGRHWKYLVYFANLILVKPDKIKEAVGDERLVRNALRNCLDFIEPYVPDLSELARLQCESQYLNSEVILYAACLEIMRTEGHLQSVKPQLLIALRTNSTHYVSEKTHNALKTEVDRIIFPNRASKENFLRQYLEPQLAQADCRYPEIHLLNDEIFNDLRLELTFNWIQQFSDLALHPLDTLFEIAAQHGNREALQKIIEERCAAFMSDWPIRTGNHEVERKRTFWLIRAWCFLSDESETYWERLKADKNTIFALEVAYSRINRSEHTHWPQLASNKVEAILDAFIAKWPKVELPSSWGSDSPKEESAYRFLKEIIWAIDSDDPDNALPVLNRLLTDARFNDMHNDLKNIRANQLRNKALRDFRPPTTQEIVKWLDQNEVVTVEGLRQLVIQELEDYQKDIDGGEFNPADRFYEGGQHLNENRCTEIIAERLHLKLESQGITITPEHQLKSLKRSDFTATKIINGKRRLLVTEVKGQWHEELYTAAAAQLYERYSIHPDAEQQGIFLALWFGVDEKVADKKRHGISNAEELKSELEAQLPQELRGLIDVFVLDVSKATQ